MQLTYLQKLHSTLLSIVQTLLFPEYCQSASLPCYLYSAKHEMGQDISVVYDHYHDYLCFHSEPISHIALSLAVTPDTLPS